MLSDPWRTISWNSFDMPVMITKNGKSSTFVYGPEHQRTRQMREDGTAIIYAGNQELEFTATAAIKTIKTYWPLGLGVEIDNVQQGTTVLHWIHKDRIGSPIAISKADGTVEEMLSFDAWEKRRTPDGSATPDTLDGMVDNKGFTGHEMLEQLDLVHMNGRVYDLLVARFLSVDPFLQDPYNGQNYSRYAYVLNNPTNFTDPTGFSCASEGAYKGCAGQGVSTVGFTKCNGDCTSTKLGGNLDSPPKDNNGMNKLDVKKLG